MPKKCSKYIKFFFLINVEDAYNSVISVFSFYSSIKDYSQISYFSFVLFKSSFIFISNRPVEIGLVHHEASFLLFNIGCILKFLTIFLFYNSTLICLRIY